MARTPRGTLPQPQARTALFAYFAARLEGVPTGDYDTFFNDLKLAVRQAGALRAMRPLKYQPPAKQRAGRHTKDRRSAATAERAVFRDWLLIEEAKLDLEVALVRFPGDGSAQAELLAALRRVAGVRHIIETQRQRDLLALVVFQGVQRRRELRARLEEIAPRIEWDDVLFETQEPTRLLWKDLARRAAVEEELSADE
jgi:hypothetical protein